eukprot:1832834-Rhodomonas_salina.3
MEGREVKGGGWRVVLSVQSPLSRVHPSPLTLHAAPFTLHPSLFTFHPSRSTPFTLHTLHAQHTELTSRAGVGTAHLGDHRPRAAQRELAGRRGRVSRGGWDSTAVGIQRHH